MSGLRVVESALGLPGPKQYAFPRPESGEFPHVLPSKRLAFYLPFALQAWMRDLSSARRGLRASLQQYRNDNGLSESSLNLLPYGGESLDFAGRLRRADWRANGLYLSQLEKRDKENEASDFGTILYLAHETPGLPHNADHIRRVELILEAYAYMEPLLRHGKGSLHDVLDGMMLSARTHDIHQAIWEYRNKYQKTQQPTKAGHAAIDSGYIGALEPDYQFEAQVGKWDARRAIGIAMLINLVHNEPEKIQARFQAKGDANAYLKLNETHEYSEHEVKNFLDAWKKCLINPFSMTRAHILILGREELKKADFDFGASKWGLEASFEEEHAGYIAHMLHDRKTLYTMISPPDKNFVQAILNGAEVLARADMVDMNAPPLDAAVRMFQVGLSAKRKLMTLHEFLSDDLKPESCGLEEEIIKKINDELGIYKKQLDQNVNVSELDKKLKINAYRYVLWVENTPGNMEGKLEDLDFDGRRFIWQLLNDKSAGRNSPVGRGVFVQSFEDVINLMGFYAYGELSGQLMKGNLGIIEKIYQNRLNELEVKFNKGRAPLWYIKSAGLWLKRIAQGEDLTAVNMVGYENDRQRLRRKIYTKKKAELVLEKEMVILNLLNKPEGIEGHLKQYNEDELQFFKAYIDAAVERYVITRKIPSETVILAKKLAQQWLKPKGLPYSGYLSLASAQMARTWIDTSPFVKQRMQVLDAMIYDSK